MGKYGGWIIAGVICLILITLAVTGIVNFGNTPTQTTPASSQSFVSGAREFMSSMHNLPLKMVA